MENKIWSAEEYLTSKHEQQKEHLGETDAEVISHYMNACRNLSVPFSNYEYKKEGILDLELKEPATSEDSKQAITKIHLEYGQGENMRSLFNPQDIKYKESLRKIKRLYIESERFIFDTDKMPVPKYGMYFMTNKNQAERKNEEEPQIISAGGYNYIANQITVNSPLTAPLGIAVFLHEMGHFLRAQNASEADVTRLSNLYAIYEKEPHKLTTEEKAAILEEERGADAIVIRETVEFLKPVTDANTIKDFSDGSLLLYSKKLMGEKRI